MTLKQQAAALDAQTERERATQEMAIEREKAQNQMQIEMFKAEQTAQLKQQEAAAEQREAADAAMAAAGDAATADRSPTHRLRSGAGNAWRQHHGMLQGLSKPRKAVIHRDPRTGKVIGAAHGHGGLNGDL